ncbi:MAG: CoA transferase, partial [Bacteroidota bacterium]
QYPVLIFGEINGYGPASSRPAFDAIIQAESGFTYLNGLPEKTYKMPVALMDVLAAHQLCQGLLLAYIKRLKTGRGSRVSVSLLQAGLSGLVNQASNWLVAGHIPQPMGSAHPNIVPYGSQYQTQDGSSIVLAVGNDRQFSALCEVLGIHPNPGWATNPGRVLDRSVLESTLQAAFKQQRSEDLMQAFHARNIPAGVVKRMPETLADPLALEILLAEKGVRRFVGTGLPRIDLSSPPKLGAHNEQIRKEFGGA